MGKGREEGRRVNKFSLPLHTHGARNTHTYMIPPPAKDSALFVLSSFTVGLTFWGEEQKLAKRKARRTVVRDLLIFCAPTC